MSRVLVEDRFEEFGLVFDQAVRRGMVEAANVTRLEAQSLAPKGETGRLSSRIHISEIDPILGGYRVAVYAAMFYSRFIEWGTLGNRKRKLKQPERRRQAAGQGTGIEPRYFMLHAGRNTEAAVLEAVVRNVERL